MRYSNTLCGQGRGYISVRYERITIFDARPAALYLDTSHNLTVLEMLRIDGELLRFRLPSTPSWDPRPHQLPTYELIYSVAALTEMRFG